MLDFSLKPVKALRIQEVSCLYELHGEILTAPELILLPTDLMYYTGTGGQAGMTVPNGYEAQVSTQRLQG